MATDSNQSVLSKSIVRQMSNRPHSFLRTAKAWDVWTIPPKNTVKGTLVPGFLAQQRRRITIEIHRVKVEKTIPNRKMSLRISFTDTEESDYYDECFVRILHPADKVNKQASKQRGREARRGHLPALHEEHQEQAPAEGHDDEETLADVFQGEFMDFPDSPSFDGWVAKYKIPLKAVTVKGRIKKSVSLLFSYRAIQQTRKIYFDTEGQAEEAVEFLSRQKQAEEERLHRKYVHATQGLEKINPREHLCLLVEIVGCTDLIAGDLTSSDPYVVAFFDGKAIHQTKHIPKDRDPIYTLKHNPLFLIETSAKELFESDGLTFEVMDYDALGKNECLGTCSIRTRSMYKANGERMTLDLENKENKGVLAVRIRRATTYDQTFMKELQEDDRMKGHAGINEIMKKASQHKGGKTTIESILTRNERTERHRSEPPVKKYRVRPGPDPKRPDETTWMTMEDMEKEMLMDSREWIDSGTGDIGRLFVEILECKNLPNLDTGGFVGNKTDAFCTLIFEDTWAQTDIIADDLDPKWMPWTKRAFTFHMYHSSSELYIGIFDYDAVDDHDLIGRVAVNVSNLQPDTLYTLTYNIYESGTWSTRDPQGQITIRLRMEIDDDRMLLLSCLEPPKTVYVNVKKRKDFNVLHHVCHGKYDMESYSMKTFFTYLDELQSYESVLMYLEEAALTLLFWRGHHAVTLFGKTYLVPLHSIFAFVTCVLLVEYPHLIPSFFFFSVAWLMVATMFFRSQQPDPWRHCKSFSDMFVALVLGDSFPPARIIANQNMDAIISHENKLKQKLELIEKRRLQALKEAEDEEAEAERAAEEIGDTSTDLSTKKGGGFIPKVDPFKAYMAPLQAYVAILCRWLRYVRNIILWEECYLSFWLTLGCMALSAACLFVPWFFLIKWTSRLFVWTVFGPWMRLVDILYWTPLENMTDEDIAQRKETQKQLRKKYLKKQVEAARIGRERAKKLKAMKKYLFGRFVVKIPVLKEDRWRDFPLPQSTAVPYSPRSASLAELAMKEAGYHRTRVPGQHLEGDMIPRIEQRAFTDAPVGQATKKHAETDSDIAAYVKVGSVVVGAAAITYYGVPLLSSVGSTILGA